MSDIDMKDFIAIEEEKNGKKYTRYVRRNDVQMVRSSRVSGTHKTLLIGHEYPDRREWEDFAGIVERRLGIKVRAGYANPLGKYLEFEMIKGIITRLYCDFWEDDGVIPARHMVEQWKDGYTQHVFKMARDKFFAMLYNNNFVLREVNDEVMKRFKERLSKRGRSRYAAKTVEESQEIQREYEIKKQKSERQRQKRENLRYILKND